MRTKALSVVCLSVAFALVVTFVESPPVSHAAFPGVNGKIAFASNRDGNSQIYVMNADGSGQTRITNNSASDSDPLWSPDGAKIVFSSNRDGNSEVYVMNADGTGQTNLTNNRASDFTPALSPDGTKIAFVSDRDQPGDCNFVGNCEIYVMNADGSAVTRLTNNPAIDFYPRWSPGGTKIAFVRGTAFGPHDIWVMNADGSGQTQLTNNGVLVTALSWSPDGTKIAFSRDGFGLFNDIWVMNADGSGQTNLTNTPAASENYPAWSPDGTRIVFSSNRDGPNDDIYVMNANGSGVTRLTDNPAADSFPDWQPLPITVAIDIKPGSFPNSINPHSLGTIPVAILSSSTFDATTQVDRTSLTFGRTGNEHSLAFCNSSGEDVNGDGLLDLVCNFNTQQTGFQAGDTVGVLKGKTLKNIRIQGSDSVRIVP